MGKGLGTRDTTWSCHKTLYDIVKDEEHDVAIIENVAAYTEKHATQCLNADWGCVSHVIDPRLFAQGCARTRRYLVLWRKSTVEWLPGMVFGDVLESLTKATSLSADDYFWKQLPPTELPPKQDRKL